MNTKSTFLRIFPVFYFILWSTMLYYSVIAFVIKPACLEFSASARTFIATLFFLFYHNHFQVKVMMRICPSLGVVDSSESMSFLKVDTRKKQLTLYDPSLNTQPTSVHRRAVLPAPKMFAFDAVFPQDASQVRAAVKMLSFWVLKRKHFVSVKKIFEKHTHTFFEGQGA